MTEEELKRRIAFWFCQENFLDLEGPFSKALDALEETGALEGVVISTKPPSSEPSTLLPTPKSTPAE